jgi:hypothetical protein
MRRGLISWSKAELPESALDARVAKVQAAMAAAGIDILAVYTNPARESGVAWLTGFIPYWNQCVMLLPRVGRPMLVAGMTARVRDWIMRNAHIEAVANTTNLGAETGRLIAEKTSDAVVAIADIDSVPGSVVDGIRASAAEVIDGGPLLERARAPADPTELAFAFKAATIAHAALANAAASETDAARLVAMIDGEARRLGAEEVFVAIAPDIAASRRLIRLEGTAVLRDAFAARISLAYKGTWVRMVRTFGRDAMVAAHRLVGRLRRFPDRGLSHYDAARTSGRNDARRHARDRTRHGRHRSGNDRNERTRHPGWRPGPGWPYRRSFERARGPALC